MNIYTDYRTKTLQENVKSIESIVESIVSPPDQSATVAILCGDSHSDTRQLVTSTYGNELLETGPHSYASGLAGSDVTYIKVALSGITSGDWITNYLATAVSQVVPGVTVAFVRLGTNDVSASVPIATIKANLTTIYKALIAAGAYVVGVSVPPGVVGFTTLAIPVNNFIQEYFKNSQGGEYCNGFKYVVDGGVSGGPWKANFANADNIHFSNIGALAESTALVPVYRRLFKPYELVCANVNNKAATASSNQILPNPLMIGNDGAGKIPSSVVDNDADVSAVYTKGTANSGFGEKQIITVTVGTAAGTKTGRFFTQNVVSLITPGHRYSAAMRLKIVSHTNLKQLRVMLVGSGGTSCLATWNGVFSASAQKVYPAGPFDFIVAKTGVMYITATANLQLGIEYGFLTSAAGAAVIEIEQMELIDNDIVIL